MVHLVDHPLVQDILLELRDVRTTPERFRQLAGRISVLLAAEALRDVPTVETRSTRRSGRRAGGGVSADVVLVPVLRAGLGHAAGHAGARADRARRPHRPAARRAHGAASQYYAKLPPRLEDSYVLMIDPMLATGGSAVAALDMLTRAGARHIRLVCIVAAPEGIAAVEKAYPDGADLHAGRRRAPQRSQVHRARAGRLRRSPVRDLHDVASAMHATAECIH